MTPNLAEARAFPSATLAPWAEVVPRKGRVTVDDLLTLPDDGWCHEVVEGVLVRMAGSGEEATTIMPMTHLTGETLCPPSRTPLLPSSRTLSASQ